MKLYHGSLLSATSVRARLFHCIEKGSLLKALWLIACLIALIAEPLHAQVKSDRGWKFFYQKKYGEALGLFEQGLRNYGKDYWVIDGVGWCCYYLGDLDRAESSFREALTIKPDYPFSLMGTDCVAAARLAPIEEAEGYLAAGRPGEARIAFDAALREAPGLAKPLKVRALLGLGRAHHGVGNYTDAAKVFQSAAKLDDKCAPAHAGLGYALMARKKYNNTASSSLQRALDLAPDDLDARLAYAWCAYHGRNTAAALKRFGAILRDRPDCWGALLGLGWCRAKKGDTVGASGHFRDALLLAPDAATSDLLAWIGEDTSRSPLRIDYAFALVALGRDDEARSLFQAAADGDYLPLARLGEALAELHLGENAAALLLARSLVEKGLDPVRELRVTGTAGTVERLSVSVSASSVLGWALLALGAYDEAVDSFTRAAGIKEVRPDAMCGLGSVHLAEERFEEAGVHFNLALNFLPGYPPAVAGLNQAASWRFADYNRAWALLEAGEAGAAGKIFLSLRNDPRNRFPADRADLIDFSLGFAACRAGNHDTAIAFFKEALRRNQALTAAHTGLGRALLEGGNPGTALAALDTACAAAPFDPVPRRLAAEALVALGRETEALERLSGWTAELVDAGLFELQGRLLIEEKRFVEARIAFETAFVLDPDRIVDSEVEEWIGKWEQFNPLAGLLGRIRQGEGRYSDAAQWHALALEKEPGDLSHHRGLALAAAALGRFGEAEAAAEKYYASLEDTYRGRSSRRATALALGWALYYGSELEKALQIFRDVEKQDGVDGRKDPDVKTALGWTWLGTGNVSRARECFLEALTFDPRLETALAGLEETISTHSR